LIADDRRMKWRNNERFRSGRRRRKGLETPVSSRAQAAGFTPDEILSKLKDSSGAAPD